LKNIHLKSREALFRGFFSLCHNKFAQQRLQPALRIGTIAKYLKNTGKNERRIAWELAL
jgi:hypothetical protein